MLSWVGDNCITVFDEDTSNLMGADPKAWLVEQGCKAMSKTDRAALSAKWTTVLLKETQAMYIPTGCLHVVVPLALKRESIKVDKNDKPAEVKKKAPGKKKKDDDNSTEYSSLLFMPVLAASDTQLSPLTVCKCVGRWMTNRSQGLHKWDKEKNWQGYLKAMEEVADRTSKKRPELARKDTSGDDDDGDKSKKDVIVAEGASKGKQATESNSTKVEV